MSSLFSSIKDYADIISDVFELTNAKIFLAKLLVLTLAFLAPMHSIIFSMLFLVFCDAITGVIAARKKKEKITSSKLSRTISKILVYFVTIVITHVINEHLLFGPDVIPLVSLVTSYIALTELKSILENLDKLTAGKMTFLGALMRAISNERFRKANAANKKIKDKPVKKIK